MSVYKLALIPLAESLVTVLALLQSRKAHAASRSQYMIRLYSILPQHSLQVY